MESRKRLLKLQKEILESVKGEVKNYLAQIPLSLKKYYHEYKHEFKSFQKVSSKKELLRDIVRSDIVFSGDYHTFNQSQRIALRILREIIKKRKKIVLGVEVFLSQHQELLDQYLLGSISEETLLEKTDYHKTWGFDWKNFKPLFDFAKKYFIKVVALNSAPAYGSLERESADILKKRDMKAAHIIASTTENYPDYLLYVIFGDLHIASNHLPQDVSGELQKKNLNRKMLFIYQNSETIYWNLANKGLEHDVDVVKLRNSAYCVMNSTPWVKLQSYLHWQEKTDALTPQLRSAWAHFASEDDIVDYNDQVYSYVKMICNFFEIERGDLDHFSVYTLEDLDFINRLSGKLSRQEINWVKEQLKYSRSFFIPRENIVYLSDLNINYASEEATKFVYSLCSGFKKIVLPEEHRFYANIFLNTLGFLGSKIINHKRKSETKIDLKEFVRKLKFMDLNETLRKKKEIGEGVLYFKEQEEKYLRTGVFHPSFKEGLPFPHVRVAVASVLGQMLGDRLYRGLIQGRFRREEVRKFFFTPVTDFERAKTIYLQLVKKLSSIRLIYKSKKEHL